MKEKSKNINKEDFDSDTSDSSRDKLNDFKTKAKEEKESGSGEIEEIGKILDDIILKLKEAVGEGSETCDKSDYQESDYQEEEKEEAADEIFYPAVVTCSKCEDNFSGGYLTYVGNERTRELISLVQLCPRCWPEYEKLIREIGLYGIERDDGKCFECGRPAHLSFRIVREEPKDGGLKDEVSIVMTDTFCFIFFCKGCMQKFLTNMEVHFLKFTWNQIYYNAIDFCNSQ